MKSLGVPQHICLRHVLLYGISNIATFGER